MKARTLIALVMSTIVIAGCYGKRMPTVAPAPIGCAPARILLVGDSLMLQSETAIRDTLARAGYAAEVRSIAHGGSNTLEYGIFSPERPPFPSPRDELAYHMSTYKPDVVLVNWGINAPYLLWSVPDSWGITSWAVSVSMEQVRDLVGRGGAALYWTTIPPRGDDLDWYASAVNGWVHELNVPTVDWRGALTAEDGNTYQQFLQYPEDDLVRPIRTEDGIHLTPDGIQHVATWSTAALAHEACK